MANYLTYPNAWQTSFSSLKYYPFGMVMPGPGNPALAQHRANTVTTASGNMGSDQNNTVNTAVVTNPSTGSSQANRSTNIIITP